MRRVSHAKVLNAVIASALAMLLAPHAPAAPQQVTDDNPLVHNEIAIAFDTGEVCNLGKSRGVAFSAVVRAPDHSWVRLAFTEATLGRTPIGGQPTMLRLTSLRDGGVQVMNAKQMREWENTSAYFNGDAVRIEIICDLGAPPSRVRMSQIMAGPIVPIDEGGLASICGSVDDRVLSSQPHTARLLPSGCTAWIINDPNRTCLTAGHCGASGSSVVQFNVPLSTGSGGLVNPPPQHQYAVDPVSVQSNNSGLGNDYCYFGCFPNSTTGYTPFEAQGMFYTLASAAPSLANPPQIIRITGYGTVSAPVSPTWNQVQKTHVDNYTGVTDTIIRYITDTTGGNSGSPVLDLSTNTAIGIHTNGGCTSTGGSNSGCAINTPGLQTALANPRGVCIPVAPIDFIYPDGLPVHVHPQGDVIRVQVVAGNGGLPLANTGQLFVDVGGGFVQVAMSEVSPNIYDAIIPESTCGSTVRYYFSAQSTVGATVTDPRKAPATFYSTLSATGLSDAFADNFQSDLAWTVSNSPTLTTGAWQRGVPVGGGDRQDPATDADGSGQCYVTGNTDGNFDIDQGSTTLTSPLLDASAPNANLMYSRWFVSTGTDDTMVVQMSDDDGASWVTLETVTGTTQAWVAMNFQIDQIAGFTPSNQCRMRFTAGDFGTQHVVEGGVDGVKIRILECGEDPGAADLNGDGFVDGIDLATFLSQWGACASCNCSADFNDDCIVNGNDLSLILSSWSGS